MIYSESRRKFEQTKAGCNLYPGLRDKERRWSEQKCKEWDELAKEDHTYELTPEERRRYKG